MELQFCLIRLIRKVVLDRQEHGLASTNFGGNTCYEESKNTASMSRIFAYFEDLERELCDEERRAGRFATIIYASFAASICTSYSISRVLRYLRIPFSFGPGGVEAANHETMFL
jgi:hypothetical protein